ncbi:hypothetical protein D3C84_616820 [compost metagenome]
MLCDFLAEAVGGFVEPGGSELRAEFLLAPVRLFAVEEFRQFDRLAEVHRHLAETLLKGADDFEDVEDRFFFLARTTQFAEVSPAFQYALVADVHRHEHDRHARGAQEAAQGDRQHPGFRLQHAPGARTATLDEVLHREAFGEQGVQVLVEHRGVERVALERAAHEEGAATPQQAADHRHVEVDPGGDVRRGQSVAKQQVGQQKVVDVAAMAGHVDHFVTRGDLLHAFDVVDLDAVVDLVPEPAQHHFHEADRGVGVVRGDLVAVAQCLGLGFFRRNVLALGFIEDRLLDQRLIEQALDQVAAVGNVRADDRRFQVAKVHPQDALGHAHGALVALVVFDQFAQVDRRGELHAGLASQDDDAQ